jgi:hypothetical protein
MKIRRPQLGLNLGIGNRSIPRFLLVFALAFSLLASGLYTYTRVSAPETAFAATSSNLNYQARLLHINGNVVPDGYYNIEFKLYDVDSGGSELWSEEYYDANGVTAGQDNRVRVVNGYLSVNLGSQTSFPAINWDQELWLTMNVGGDTQTATPTYDGEMDPRIKLTAVPYAFKAGQLAKRTGGNTSTLDFATQTGARSILLPDESGTICLQASSNCGFVETGDFSLQGAYDGGNTLLTTDARDIDITLANTSTDANFIIDIASSSTGEFQIESNGTDILQIGSAGQLQLDVQGSAGGLLIGGDALLYRSASNTFSTGSGDSLVVSDDLTVLSDTNSSNSVNITNSSLSVGRFTKAMTAGTGGVSQFDVVVLNSSGEVVRTTTPRDPQVYGVVPSGISAAATGAVTIAGNSTINVDTAAIAVGDQLVTSSTSGRATVDNGATTGIIGTALSSKAGGSNGTVSISVRPVNGQYTPVFRSGSNSTTAFQVQDSGGSALLNVDTSNNQLEFDSSTELIWGGDTNLFRAASNTLATNSDLQVEHASGSSTAFQVRVAAGYVFNVDTSSNLVTIATDDVGLVISNFLGSGEETSMQFQDDGSALWSLGVNAEGNTNDFYIFNEDSSTYTLRIDQATDTVTVNGSILPGTNDTYDLGSDSLRWRDLYAGPGTIHVGTSTSDEGTLSYNTSTNNLVMGATNGVLVQNAGDSTTAFQVQRTTGGSTIFNIDTSTTSGNRNGIISVGTGSGTSATLFRLDVKTDSGDPTGAEGAMYYNDNSNKFRCYQNSGWTDCIGAGGSTTLQDAYDNSSNPATILTADSKDILFSMADTSTDANFRINVASGSASEFQVEANGTDVLQIGSAGQLQLDVQGSGGGLQIGGDATLYRSAANTLTVQTLNATTGINTGATAGTQRIDASGNLVNIGNLTGSSAVAIASGGTAQNITLDGSTSGQVLIGGASTGDILFGGGSSSTGCTITNSTGALACAGNITGPTTGTVGYWSRSGATLQPATGGDAITTSGNISTSSSGTITSAGLLTGQAGATISGAAISLNASSNFATNINTGNSNGTVSIGNNTGNTAINIDSGTSTIAIGTGGQARTINLGTGAAAQTVTVGSTNGGSILTLQAGTGGLNLTTQGTGALNVGNNAVAQTINIGNATGATAVSILCGTGTCGFGNNAVAHTTTVGSVTGAATTNIQAGTGGLNLGDSGVANTIQIGNTTGAVNQTINIGTNNTASSATTLTIGSLIGTSPTTIQAGTSGVLVEPANGSTAFQVQNTSNISHLLVDTTNNMVEIGDTSTANAPIQLALDHEDADPGSTQDGAMYYNTSTNTFRCRENGEWKDCLSRHVLEMSGDVSDSTGASCSSYVDLTGLSFAVVSGRSYRFNATIGYSSTSNNNGSNWSVNGPTNSFLAYTSRWSESSIGGYGVINSPNYNQVEAGECAVSSTTGNGFASIEGVVTPTANGTVTMRMASEAASGGTITAKAGSTLEWW